MPPLLVLTPNTDERTWSGRALTARQRPRSGRTQSARAVVQGARETARGLQSCFSPCVVIREQRFRLRDGYCNPDQARTGKEL